LVKRVKSMAKLEVEFGWCRGYDEAIHLSQIFADNVTSSYISHAELQGLRALDPSTWSPNIRAVLAADLTSRINQPLDAHDGERTKLLACGRIRNEYVAVFLVGFSRAAAVAYTEIEDMVVVSAARDGGVGHAFLEWVAEQSRQRGIKRIFLESGVRNARAHKFFEETGFHQVSMVMMKSLQ